MYDKNNVFAKIARGEIPTNKICENEFAMSFNDVNPVAKIHALVIPKGEYKNILEFTKNASADEQAGFWACFNDTADKLGVNGCNVIANVNQGPFSYQSVPHFHIHIIAGEKLQNFEDITK